MYSLGLSFSTRKMGMLVLAQTLSQLLLCFTNQILSPCWVLFIFAAPLPNSTFIQWGLNNASGALELGNPGSNLGSVTYGFVTLNKSLDLSGPLFLFVCLFFCKRAIIIEPGEA